MGLLKPDTMKQYTEEKFPDLPEDYYKEVEKKYGKKPGIYSDFRKMLERKDLNGVGIAVPLYLHAPIAIGDGARVGTATLFQAREGGIANLGASGGTATVEFELAQEQVKDSVLRVGTTLSFKGGRPSVKIGSWTGKDPGAPVSI